MKRILLLMLLLLALLLVSCDSGHSSESLPSESLGEEAEHVCDFTGTRKNSEDGHYVTCTCGEVSKGEHVFADNGLYRAPTCESDGAKDVICIECGYTETVSLERLEHERTVVAEVASTCLERGITKHEHCDICDIDVGAEYLEYAHIYENDICTVCGSWRSEGVVAADNDGWYYASAIKNSDIENIVVPKYALGGKLIVGIEKSGFTSRSIKTIVIQYATYIKNGAFSGSGIEKITFPTDPIAPIVIENNAFSGCRNLKEIDLTNVGSIGVRAFEGCRALKSVTLPDTVTTLPENVFAECLSLKSVTFSDNLKSVGEYLFRECYSLKTVDLGNGLERIPTGMFHSCSALEKIVLPDSVVSIGNKVFYGCEKLKTVTLSKNTEIIGEYAFAACISLEELTIPKSVKRIYGGAFDNCLLLKEIKYEGTVEEWRTIMEEVSGEGYETGTKKAFTGSKVERVICSDGVIKVK